MNLRFEWGLLHPNQASGKSRQTKRTYTGLNKNVHHYFFPYLSQTECLAATHWKGTELRIICLSFQYSAVSKASENVIKKKKSWHILDTDPALKQCFFLHPHAVHKRPPDLCNMLAGASSHSIALTFTHSIVVIANDAISHIKLIHPPPKWERNTA